MRWEQQVLFASRTDIGLRRKNNEDSSAVHLCQTQEEFEKYGHLFVVADGMGGHAVGELASKLAVDTLPHSYFKMDAGRPVRGLKSSIELANETIHQRGIQNRDFQRMGTTCTALVLCPLGAVIGHIGDSRAYRIRGERIDQLSCDHSLEWELKRRGQRDVDPAFLQQHRNVITRSLGPEREIEVDVEGPFPVLPGDIFLLCSDGLSGQVHDEEMAAIVRALQPTEACRLLVHLANLRGGPDNSTVVVVSVDSKATLLQEEPGYSSPSDDQQAVLDWSWYLAFWVAACTLVLGVSLTMLSYPKQGAFFTGLAALFIIGLTLAFIRRRHDNDEVIEVDDGELSRTHIFRPYRTALARSDKEFVQELSTLTASLERSAQEDGWDVNWKRYRDLVDTARTAVGSNKIKLAFRTYASAIDELFGALTKSPSTTADGDRHTPRPNNKNGSGATKPASSNEPQQG